MSVDERLPALNPDVAASILESATPRIDRKATSLIETSADWGIENGAVTVGTARVSIDDGNASCDCLLAPKCAHLLAVARLAPVAGVPASPAPRVTKRPGEFATPAPRVTKRAGEFASPAPRVTKRARELRRIEGMQPDDETQPPQVTLTDTQRRAVEAVTAVSRSLLQTGLHEITTVQRGAVLRCIQACRIAALPKLGAETTALHTVLAEPADRDVAALRDVVLAAHRLLVADAAGAVGLEELGTARRSFETIGTLKLRGIACEPVLTDSGYSGVATYFVDDAGTGFELGSVVPGGADGVAAAYRRPAGLGEYPATPAELARTGVLIAGATVSDDGRLGKGKTLRAKAIAAAGGLSWAGALPPTWRSVAGPVDADEHGLVVGGTSLSWTQAGRRLGVGPAPFADGDECLVLAREGEVLGVEYATADGDRTVWFPGLDHPLGIKRAIVVDPLAQDDFPADERGPAAVLRRWMRRVGRHGVGVLERDRAAVAADVEWLARHGSPYRSELLAGLASSDDVVTAWLRVAVAAD